MVRLDLVGRNAVFSMDASVPYMNLCHEMYFCKKKEAYNTPTILFLPSSSSASFLPYPTPHHLPKTPPTSHTSLHTHAPTPPNLRHSLTQRLAHFPAAHHPREPPFHHLVLLLLGFAVAVRGDEGMGRGPTFLDRNGFVAREASGCHCWDRALFSVFCVFFWFVFLGYSTWIADFFLSAGRKDKKRKGGKGAREVFMGEGGREKTY